MLAPAGNNVIDGSLTGERLFVDLSELVPASEQSSCRILFDVARALVRATGWVVDCRGRFCSEAGSFLTGSDGLGVAAVPGR